MHEGVLVGLTADVLALGEVARVVAGRLEGGRPPGVASGVSIDSRTLRPGDLFVAIVGPRFDGHDFLGAAAAGGASAAVIHRDVAAPPGLPLLRVSDTTRALGDLAHHVRRLAEIPVVCITGSAGKTTTKDMTAALLATRGAVLKTERNLNNQYGLPLTLLRLRPEHEAAVLELGMSAAGELSKLSRLAEPDVAVITLVAPVHLEFFESVEAIASAKAEILEGLASDGVVVLNVDDERLRRIGERERSRGRRVSWFGRDRSCDVSFENWRGTVHGMRFDLRVGGRTFDVALPLPGIHFATNFLAAVAVAHHLGIEPGAIVAAATEMRASTHRGQVLRLGERITLLDDCYNSNPFAADAAVTALGMAAQGRRVLFLGEMRELGATAQDLHRQLGATLVGRADVVVGVGPLAQQIIDGAHAAGLPKTALHHFADSDSAAQAAGEIVKEGDAVLIKGSRGVEMERIVDALKARYGPVES